MAEWMEGAIAFRTSADSNNPLSTRSSPRIYTTTTDLLIFLPVPGLSRGTG
jgi:hypothetical protein